MSPAVVATTSRHRRLTRAVTAAPDRILLLLFWTCLVVATTLVLGVFHPWTVLPVLAVLLVLTWRWRPIALTGTRTDVWSSAAALLGTAGWVVVNAPYAAQFVVVTRDPGFLTLAGYWLSRHPHPDIPVASSWAVAEQVGAYVSTGAYDHADDVLHVQGADLLPGLLAIGGWAGGLPAVLVGNLVLGACALIGVFALTRRIAGSVWALLPTAALAMSLPMLAFSRGAYTEPVVAALVLGGLVMAWSAFSRHRRSDLVLAGAMVGAGALARIDGAAVLVGFFLGVGLAVGATTLPRLRRTLRTDQLLMTAAGAAVVTLGLVDLALHSPRYLARLQGEVSSLTLATVTAAVVGLALTTRRPWQRLRAFLLTHRRTVARVAVAAVVVAAVVLTSRPAWLVERHIDPSTGYGTAVENLQNAAGQPVDRARSYDEQSVSWLAWYLGWPAVALGFGGLAAMVGRSIRWRDPRLLVVAAAIGAPTLLYLVRVSITPDQIWAVRRFLPVTIPGLLVLATWSLAQLWTWLRTRIARAGVLALTAAVALAPMTTWADLLRSPDHAGQVDQLEAVCQRLARLDADRVVFVNTGRPYLASLISVCEVEVIEFRELPDPARLARARTAWGGGTVGLVTFDAGTVGWSQAPTGPTTAGTISIWEQALTRAPRTTIQWEQSIWVGTIGADGRVVPAP